jgi:DNA-binding IclR family transcriptional regulator
MLGAMTVRRKPTAGHEGGKPPRGNVSTTLLKGIGVLEAFDSAHRDMSLTDIVRATGLEISGARRLLATLVSASLLAQDADTRRYRLTAKVLHWSVAYLGADPLVSCAYPILDGAARRSGLQFELSVLWKHECVVLLSMPGERGKLSFVKGPSAGVREPAFCASTGLAILSGMPTRRVFEVLSQAERRPVTEHTVTDLDRIMAAIAEAREQGFAITDRSCHPRAISVAAAVFDHAGVPVAAICASVDVDEYDLDRARRELSPLVVSTAQAISHSYQRAT